MDTGSVWGLGCLLRTGKHKAKPRAKPKAKPKVFQVQSPGSSLGKCLGMSWRGGMWGCFTQGSRAEGGGLGRDLAVLQLSRMSVGQVGGEHLEWEIQGRGMFSPEKRRFV